MAHQLVVEKRQLLERKKREGEERRRQAQQMERIIEENRAKVEGYAAAQQAQQAQGQGQGVVERPPGGEAAGTEEWDPKPRRQVRRRRPRAPPAGAVPTPRAEHRLRQTCSAPAAGDAAHRGRLVYAVFFNLGNAR